MGDVDSTWAEEERLAPGASKCRNIRCVGNYGCFKTGKAAQAHRGNLQDLVDGDAGRGAGCHGGLQRRRIADEADQYLRLRVVRDYVRRTPAGNNADVQGGLSE